ncbi:MAG: protein translocase subunit SecD [Candidatus Hydrothermales bacterium]
MPKKELERKPKEEVRKLLNRALSLGLDLVGGMYLVLKVEAKEKEKVKDARDRVLEIIRNRIDQWGVYEPVIQPVGEDRIMVQLPGVMERERAREIIGKTAVLTFHLVEDIEKTKKIIDKIDNSIKPLLFLYRGDIVFEEIYFDSIKKILRKEDIKSLLPPDKIFMFGKSFEVEGKKLRPLFLLNKDPDVKGEHIKDAIHSVYQGDDPILQNTPIVNLSFDRKGTIDFARVTGENVGRRLAIVLDSIVQSAPRIAQKIPTGNAQITGIETMEEARDLAVILRAGALPAPVEIEEERSVGPLLGKDSIRRGIQSAILGGILVMIFMAIYYVVGGFISNFALLLNLVIILALLSLFKGTLTLPGIAGLVLTIGMAVDANVLIFERIREELRLGKSFKAAVDTGYQRALITILDSNLTTIIAALVLIWFGTGPIRGFGLVLALGISASFFTAIFVTRAIFDYFLVVKKVKKLAI